LRSVSGGEFSRTVIPEKNDPRGGVGREYT
jgi:hypothetical protein